MHASRDTQQHCAVEQLEGHFRRRRVSGDALVKLMVSEGIMNHHAARIVIDTKA